MHCNDHLFAGLSPDLRRQLSRRTFLRQSAGGIGLAALSQLLGNPAQAATAALGAKWRFS